MHGQETSCRQLEHALWNFEFVKRDYLVSSEQSILTAKLMAPQEIRFCMTCMSRRRSALAQRCDDLRVIAPLTDAWILMIGKALT